MNQYICGPSIEAINSEDALSQTVPVYKLATEIALSDSIVCIPRQSIGTTETTLGFIVTMVIFSILGVIAGKTL